MNVYRLLMISALATSAAATCPSAMAKGLVAYYQIGGDPTPGVKWDTYVIDSDSLARDGIYIRYKSFIVTSHGSSPPQEAKADCKSSRYGLASDTSTYATYPGTIAGEEVKVACDLAGQQGLLKD